MTPSLSALVFSEIVERHRFFERWFNGGADGSEFEASLLRFDPLFRRIDPAGTETDRDALEASLSARLGSRRTDPVRILVENPTLLWCNAEAALVAYVEAQSSPAAPMPSRRRSTALFIASPGDAPLWRHVQETFIPTFDQPGGAHEPAATSGDGL